MFAQFGGMIEKIQAACRFTGIIPAPRQARMTQHAL